MDVAEHTDAAVAALREELIGLVTAAGGTMTLDALRSARPAWFRGAHILALNGRPLASRLSAAFCTALGAELAPGGQLLATRVYLVGRTPQRLPISKDRQRCHSSHWWPVELELRSRPSAS